MTKTDKLIREAEEKCEWFKEQGARFEQIEDEMTGDEPEKKDVPHSVVLAIRDAERQKAVTKHIQERGTTPSGLDYQGYPLPAPGLVQGKAMELAEELAARDRAFAKLAKELEEVKEKLRHVTEQLQQERAPRSKKRVDRYGLSSETDNMKKKPSPPPIRPVGRASKPKDKVMVRFLRHHRGHQAGAECEVTPDKARSWCDVPAPPARRI